MRQPSATTGKGQRFRPYHGHRNLVWTYAKNLPGPLFWVYLPYHIALNVAAIAWYALSGRWRVVLKAKWDAIKGLPGIWQKRKKIHAHRLVTPCETLEMMINGLPGLGGTE